MTDEQNTACVYTPILTRFFVGDMTHHGRQARDVEGLHVGRLATSEIHDVVSVHHMVAYRYTNCTRGMKVMPCCQNLDYITFPHTGILGACLGARARFTWLAASIHVMATISYESPLADFAACSSPRHALSRKCENLKSNHILNAIYHTF